MAKSSPQRASASVSDEASDVGGVIGSLRRLASKTYRDGMLRYGIPNDNAFGVPVGALQKLAKQLGKNHRLAAELWETRYFEARMLACFLDESDKVTPAQMDRWCRDFDSWAIVDTACFHLFDKTPHAWKKVEQWAHQREEFGKRAAFALLASLALHDKAADDQSFGKCLPLIERAATDDRNFVKKGVSWALRSMGRRSSKLHATAVALAQRLSASADATARWVGKDALRDLNRPAVAKKLTARRV